MTPADVRVRADAARKFLEVAGMVADGDPDAATAGVAGSLAVMSGIAASDAMCGHVLKRRPLGQDHGQAAEVLATVRGAEESARALSRLLTDKGTSQYGTTYLTPARARDMVRRAQIMVEAMELLLRR